MITSKDHVMLCFYLTKNIQMTAKATKNFRLLTLLTLCLSLTSLSSYAEQSGVNATLFNKLKNTPTLDLANPKLESSDYRPLGLPLIRPTPEQKNVFLNKNQTTHSTQTLAKCSFIGVNIELDDVISTQEFLFTPENNCLKINGYKSKPFWILQQRKNQTPQVLIADLAYQVRIWNKEIGMTHRRVETILKGNAASRYTQKPMEVKCHGSWSFTSGRYIQAPDQNYLEVYRSTPSSNTKTWVIVEGQDPYVKISDTYRCPR